MTRAFATTCDVMLVQIPNLALDSNIVAQFLQRMSNDLMTFSDMFDDLFFDDDNGMSVESIICRDIVRRPIAPSCA